MKLVIIRNQKLSVIETKNKKVEREVIEKLCESKFLDAVNCENYFNRNIEIWFSIDDKQNLDRDVNVILFTKDTTNLLFTNHLCGTLVMCSYEDDEPIALNDDQVEVIYNTFNGENKMIMQFFDGTCVEPFTVDLAKH